MELTSCEARDSLNRSWIQHGGSFRRHRVHRDLLSKFSVRAKFSAFSHQSSPLGSTSACLSFLWIRIQDETPEDTPSLRPTEPRVPPRSHTFHTKFSWSVLDLGEVFMGVAPLTKFWIHPGIVLISGGWDLLICA